jgi:glycine C-acetyltransferase
MHRIVNEEIRGRADFVAALKERRMYTYCLEVTSSCSNVMTVDGKECVNFISNNYLGFSTHPRVKEAAGEAVKKYGLGIGGSPLMCGTTDLHNRLKERIASIYGQEGAALFASGYQALLGAIQATVGKGDAALVDYLVHRSIVDGVTLAGCEKRMWMHNDMEDLESLLSRAGKKYKRMLIIVDSVYSMDGDIADLPEMKRLSDRYNALILIDAAHSLGVIGPHGRGLLDHYGMPDGADIIAGTFSKFAGAVGGFVAGPADYISHLNHAASPYIFSASLPPVLCAGVLAAFDLLDSEPQWRQQLWENVRYFIAGLKDLGFDTGKSQTPVVPLLIRDPEKTMLFNRMILDRGIYASPVVYPAVGKQLQII